MFYHNICWNKNVNVNPYIYNPPYKNIIGTYIIPTDKKRKNIFTFSYFLIPFYHRNNHRKVKMRVTYIRNNVVSKKNFAKFEQC